jgi:soluble lytic murein transglycosylase-like protein
MTQEEMIALARATAAKHDLDEALVCALCDHESAGWNPWAMRYEPKFFQKYVASLYAASKISATEAYARSFSYGLGQVMGQTAREFGFEGKFLTELCDPPVGIEFACRKLAKAMALAHGDVNAGLLRYNGGADPSYPEKVTLLVPKYNPEVAAESA